MAAGAQPRPTPSYSAVVRSKYFQALVLAALLFGALVYFAVDRALLGALEYLKANGAAPDLWEWIERMPWLAAAATAFAGMLGGMFAGKRAVEELLAGGGPREAGAATPAVAPAAAPRGLVDAAERLARGDLRPFADPAVVAEDPGLRALDRARVRFGELSRRALGLLAETQIVADRVRGTVTGSIERMAEIVSSVGETGAAASEMSASLKQISEHMEQLASSAEESSSSILEMAATNDEVAENIQNLAASVGETATSIEEMAYSIKEVAKNIEALSSMTEETSSSMSEMDISISQVEANATETARLSDQVRRDAFEGVQALGKTIDGINRIKSSSGEAAGVIFALEDKIKAIGKILSVIDDVAEQTNLLALNAAIIAAQAGEHGKGFSVVADEIKDLADRAGASTKEIATLIESVTHESQRAVRAMEIGVRSVEEGVRLAESTETALKQILGSATKATDMVNAIARTTVEQSRGSKQVTDSIARIAETFTQIATATAEQARGTELIMKSAEQMKIITQHVERSSQEQARGSKQITMSIENISKMVNQVNVAQREQARGSDAILLQVERVKGIVEQQEQGQRALVDVVGDLSVRVQALEKEFGTISSRASD